MQKAHKHFLGSTTESQKQEEDILMGEVFEGHSMSKKEVVPSILRSEI